MQKHKKEIQKLKLIMIIMAFIALISATTGSYLYYSLLKETAFYGVYNRAISESHAIKNRISAYLLENQKAVKILSALTEIKDAAIQSDEIRIELANKSLDHFNKTMNLSVCYLMNNKGDTIATSNRYAPDSFLHKNYAFRPYFQMAIQGKPWIYMALGVTSGKRGVYYSYPVYSAKEKKIIGVVVIKTLFEKLEKELSDTYQALWLLTDPNGIVFGSNNKKWLYQMLWEMDEKKLDKLRLNRQFGEGPYESIGLKFESTHFASTDSENRYLIQIVVLEDFKGWQVVHLTPFATMHKTLIDPLVKSSGFAIGFFIFLVISSVTFLYRKALKYIIRLISTENAYRESENMLQAVINTTMDAMFAFDKKHAITIFNSAAENMFKVYRGEILGKHFDRIAPEKDRRKYRKIISSYFNIGKPAGIIGRTHELNGMRKDGSVFPLELSLSAGRHAENDFIIAVARDVSERKLVEQKLMEYQKQLRSLSSQLVLVEERERRQIAMDLHDRISQTLALSKMKLSALYNAIEKPVNKEKLQQIIAHVNQSIQDSRSLTFELSPPVLYEFGFEAAIEWLIEELQTQHGIQFTFTSDKGDKKFEASIRILLYRATREVLYNIIKHAQAKNVNIRLTVGTTFLKIVVADDGVGFDLDSNQNKKLKMEGFGLFSIRERLKNLSGRLEIQNIEPKGARVTLITPIENILE